MVENKVLVVTGATGNQGGAVVKHLMNSSFTIKAVTCKAKRRIGYVNKVSR